MKRILKNKWGVTLLEGVIALGLLSLAAASTFGVLLSISRKSSRPDLQEEMLWAVERAHSRLQLYVGVTDMSSLPKGLCAHVAGQDDAQPLNAGTHTINCMLPAICDKNASSFSYVVTNGRALINAEASAALSGTLNSTVENANASDWQGLDVEFSIKCNGFTL